MGEAKRKKEFVRAWCDRMSARYGPRLVDNDGVEWTWRAALEREAMGGTTLVPRNGATLDSVPSQLELECAKMWEAGFWPHWAHRPTQLILPGDEQ